MPAYLSYETHEKRTQRKWFLPLIYDRSTLVLLVLAAAAAAAVAAVVVAFAYLIFFVALESKEWGESYFWYLSYSLWHDDREKNATNHFEWVD